MFEGPLDLLLQLIERAQLDITHISLAQVSDQYLAYVRALDTPDPRSLAEFVSLAARLLLIKSRVLLPRSPAASTEVAAVEDDAEALVQQLREYQRYKQVALVLRAWQDQGRQTFLRTAAPVEELLVANHTTLSHTLTELIGALERRMQLTLPLDAPTALPLLPRLTVSEVIRRIGERLSTCAWFSFEDLLALTTTRQEIIVTFWAVLELLKRRAIVVEQHTLFGAIGIGRGDTLDSVLVRGDSADD